MSEHVHLTLESAKKLVESGSSKTTEEKLEAVLVYKECESCLVMLHEATIPSAMEVLRRDPDAAKRIADDCLRVFNRYNARQN